MSKADEIKRELVQMIADCTHDVLVMHNPVDMYGPYFKVEMADRDYYFKIVLEDVDEDQFSITENYQP